MNLENLDKKAVRSARATARVASLSERELKAVVGSRFTSIIGDDNPQPIEPEPGHPSVPPEVCAIHFYYPADGAV